MEKEKSKISYKRVSIPYKKLQEIRKAATHLLPVKHMWYIPNTISLVSFVLISFQHVSSLLHSPELMRHNAEKIANMSLPPGHVSTRLGASG